MERHGIINWFFILAGAAVAFVLFYVFFVSLDMSVFYNSIEGLEFSPEVGGEKGGDLGGLILGGVVSLFFVGVIVYVLLALRR